MWYVVLFDAENSVSAVPSTWYVETSKECMWPPASFKQTDFEKYVKERYLPEEDWRPHGAKIVGQYDKYKDAIAGLAAAKLSLSSSSEGGKKDRKRKRRPTARYMESDSSGGVGSDDDSGDHNITYPKPPSLDVLLHKNDDINDRTKRNPVSEIRQKENKTGKLFFRSRSGSLSPSLANKTVQKSAVKISDDRPKTSSTRTSLSPTTYTEGQLHRNDDSIIDSSNRNSLSEVRQKENKTRSRFFRTRSGSLSPSLINKTTPTIQKSAVKTSENRPKTSSTRTSLPPTTYSEGEMYRNGDQFVDSSKRNSLSEVRQQKENKTRSLFFRTRSGSLSPSLVNKASQKSAVKISEGRPKTTSTRTDLSRTIYSEDERNLTITPATILQYLKKMHSENLLFQQQTERKLTQLNLKIVDVEKAVKRDTEQIVEENPEVLELLQLLPLTMERLATLESNLARTNEDVKKQLAMQLSLVGGQSVQEIVKRLMYKMFKNETGMQYSWDGAKGKLKFRDLGISTIIISAVRLNPSTRSATEADIVFIIKKWLVRSKERLHSGKSNSREDERIEDARNE